MTARDITVAVLTIGDEILYGQTLDTNSQWMGSTLDSNGFKLVYRATVGDNEKDILDGLSICSNKADIILITGGLGPTNDDLTKPCLAKYFNVELKSNPGALAELTALFKQINRELSESNIKQTVLPSNADYISNKMGTAPGIWIEDKDKIYVSMPGVPYEMKAMISDIVLPKLQRKFKLPHVEHKMIRTIGIGESWLAEKIADWEQGLPANIKLAYLPSLGQVKIRLTSQGDDISEIENGFNKAIEDLKPLAGQYIYGYGREEIEEVVGRILTQQNLTLATAESCTGGYLAHLITRVPGSSSYFKGSTIAYANEIKAKHLGVPDTLLNEFGAVSEETVKAMAVGVQKQMGVDIGLATSGIAGPDGGTEDKPVGTIWIAVAYGDVVEAKKLSLFKDRGLNIKLTAISTIAMLWRILAK
jgi:nicotinamide-nucleotide amidase